MLAAIIVLFLMLMHVVSILVTTASVGKPRKPVTSGVAVGVTVWGLLYIVGLAYVGSRAQ